MAGGHGGFHRGRFALAAHVDRLHAGLSGPSDGVRVVIDDQRAGGRKAAVLQDPFVVGRTGLVRTQAGVFRIEDSVMIEQVIDKAESGDWRELAMPVDTPLQHLGKITLSPMFAEMVQHGRQLSIADVGVAGDSGAYEPGDRIRAYTPGGELLAILIFEPERLGWRPEKVLAAL